MDLPNRIKQHKAESDSYAILLYKLKDIGIFRNTTDNDYGIDFELEFVESDTLIGNYLKIQVKSSDNPKINKDNIPTWSGIKQSTLYYWANLSYKSHVVVYLVDNIKETIYITKPIFWQVIKLFDSSNKTKSIKFLEIESIDDIIKTTKSYKNIPSLSDEIHSHKMALRNLTNFIQILDDSLNNDYTSEIDLDIFSSYLDVLKVLLYASDDIEKNELNLHYWKNKSCKDGDMLFCGIIKDFLTHTLPLLFQVLQEYENNVFDSKYYWETTNLEYLKLVYNNLIPSYDCDLKNLLNNYTKDRKGYGFEYFLKNKKMI